MMLALLMLLTATPASENADAEIDRALQLYKAFKLADGIKVLGVALQRSTLPAKERGRVYVYVGLGEASRGNDVAAKRAFDQALAYDPGATLPELASPKTKALFAQALAALPPPPKPKPDPPVEEPKPLEPPKPVADQKPAIVVEPEPEPASSHWWIMPAVIGLVSTAAGAVMIQQSESRYSRLTTGMGVSITDANALASQGSALQTGAWIAFGFATAGAITTFVLYLMSR